jgi:hypothetical protein
MDNIKPSACNTSSFYFLLFLDLFIYFGVLQVVDLFTDGAHHSISDLCVSCRRQINERFFFDFFAVIYYLL